MTKDQLRQMARDIRARMSEDVRERLSANMVARLLPVLKEKKPEIVGLYYPIGSEISPLSVISSEVEGPQARDLSTRLTLGRNDDVMKFALPVIRQDKSLEFYEWRAGDKLVTRDFNIPIPDTRSLSPVDPDILIMPLLLCDVQGNRIGYGKGHYDRYIAACDPRPYLIGVCFDEQIYDTPIKAEAHDVPLDMIVTGTKTIVIPSEGEAVIEGS